MSKRRNTGTRQAGRELAIAFPNRHIPAPAMSGEMDPRFARELAAAAELANNSIARSTRTAYQDAWGWFVTYCTQRNVSPLPADPAVVAAWISSMVHPSDDDGTQTAGTGLSAASIEVRLAAVNKAHKIAGYPPPGAHPEVALVKSGAMRTVGVRAKRRKRPLLVEELREVCGVMDRVQTGDATEVALASLLGNKTVDRAGPAALARLRGDDITIDGDDIYLVLRPHRSKPLTVVLDDVDARVCDAWQQVCDAADGWPLFADRAAVVRVARRLCGLPAKPMVWPTVTATQAQSVLAELFVAPLGVVRDKAMLLAGFSTAGRRSNLCALVWDDCVLVPGRGVRVLFRFSKTDQIGRGMELWLPYGQDPSTCPVAAFEAWRARAHERARHNGVELSGADPVFVQVDRHGNGRWHKPLSPEGFVGRLKLWAAAVGLPAEQIGGHTLRSGFITTAVLAGLRLDEIRSVSGHASVDMLMRYVREVEQWRHNPAANIGL